MAGRESHAPAHAPQSQIRRRTSPFRRDAIGDAALPQVLDASQDESPDVRRTALAILAQSSTTPESQATLLAALDDDDGSVAYSALHGAATFARGSQVQYRRMTDPSASPERQRVLAEALRSAVGLSSAERSRVSEILGPENQW